MLRYSNIDYVLALDFITGLELIKKAAEAEQENKLYQLWLAQIPRYNAALLINEIPKEASCTFTEFKNRATKTTQIQTVEQQMALCKALTLAFGGTVIET